MLGMSLGTLTTVHVVISLVALAAGAVVLAGMLSGDDRPAVTALFLGTTIATSVTGFMFPFNQVLPSHLFGAISLVALAIAVYAAYSQRFRGVWRRAYVVTALLALYLNAFVAVVQAFQKLALLRPLAPTQSEPPFLIAQALLLGLFIWAGIRAMSRFHPWVRA